MYLPCLLETVSRRHTDPHRPRGRDHTRRTSIALRISGSAAPHVLKATLLVLACLLGLSGCAPGQKPPKKDDDVPAAKSAETAATDQDVSQSDLVVDEKERQPAAKMDEPQSLEELQPLATGLKKSDEGFVVEVDFRGAVITDAALTPLLGLPRLKSVLLNDTAITDAGLATLGKIPTLRNLDLRGCKIGNAGLMHLSGLTGLEALRLNGESGATTVDDQAMEALANMTSMKALLLDHLWISEEGLAQLDKLNNLKELYLARTLVGDEALAKLKQFPQLKKLRISATQITSTGLAGVGRPDQSGGT